MNASERVRSLVEPSLDASGVELVDVDQAGTVLRVTVDRPGGIDLDTIARVTTVVSSALDREPELVAGRYTLEVSSPGVERPLRTPEHFRRFVGTKVAVRTTAGTEGERRIEGVLESAGDDGIVVAGRSIAYSEVERARTVFEWPARRPKKARAS